MIRLAGSGTGPDPMQGVAKKAGRLDRMLMVFIDPTALGISAQCIGGAQG